MKIILNPVEALEFKKTIKALDESSRTISEALCVPHGEEDTMSDFFNGCKFANVQIGFQGVTINIDPHFVSDFLNIYADTITVVGVHISALVGSLTRLNAIGEVRMSKWV